MKFDQSLEIAVGASAESKSWKNKKVNWSQLVQRLSQPTTTSETYKEYIASSKEDQQRIKDIGGYVGGLLRNGKRSIENVVHRQLITLDIDFAHLDFWEDFILMYDIAAILHSTHKHHRDSPRFRLVIPTDREMAPDEYIAVSRKIAGNLGIDMFDNTTFDVNRLMFWPSTPRDVEYVFRFQDGPFVSVDDILSQYIDWTDSSEWPISSEHMNRVKNSAQKQEDPENKKGIVGAFCRTYNIHEAIEKFIPEVYIKASDDRYSYSKGSTSSGVIVYEDKFIFSHHGTDPCSGKLCNAFDMVRIHKFGAHESEKESFKAMEDFCRVDESVKKLIASEILSEAKYDFQDSDENVDIMENVDWMKELETDVRGRYLSSSTNISMIFSNDIRLKKLFRLNRFDNKCYVFGSLPWRKVKEPEPIRNVDFSGIRNYIESIYGISSNSKVEDALTLEFEKNSYHPITDYLRSLTWDGKNRIDTLLIDYFGADDNIYTREAIRKPLCAAVARAFEPGVKFDLVLTLVGSQGCGKSTFFRKLGKQYFSDTFMTVQGKEALEQIQGSWLIEIGELSGLRKADVDAIKLFLSKQSDTFRPAYGRTTETYLRQCVFFGTTNNSSFLKDPSGDRRWMPIDVVNTRVVKSVFEDLTDSEVDQIWAEAYKLYSKGEKLYLSAEAEKIANKEQRDHSETDERRGIIEDYLEKLLPNDWDSMDTLERRIFLEDPLSKGVRKREYVCVAEVWCECLGKNREDMDRYKTRDINDILRSLPDWQPGKSVRNFKIYGKQKHYERKID